MTFIVLNIIPFMRYLSSIFLLFLLVSCRSLDPTTLHNATQSYTTLHHATRDTVVLRDTVFRHDSVIYRERTIHDTVYITKEVYRDALNSKFKIQNSIVHDTIIRTDSIVQVIEHPPRTYTPKFYKWSTAILWIGIIAYIAYLFLRNKILLPKG